MDNYQKLREQVIRLLFVAFLAMGAVVSAIWWAADHVLHLTGNILIALVIVIGLFLAWAFASISSSVVLEPLKAIWQAVVHIAPGAGTVAAPNMEKLRIGRELVTSLTLQIYQYASHEDGKEITSARHEMLQATNIISRFPMPLFVFNKQQLVTNASLSALEYCQIESSKLFGKPLFDSLNLEFPTENTLETWIAECQKNKVKDNAYWQRVHVLTPDGKTVRQCDIAAYYSRDNPSGTEFIVTLFDHTDDYNQDDQSMSFVALAVHELRTPLTVLRGYVEVFEDELGDKLDDELKDFMYKMKVSADQLASFVNNILNVARVEENQLVLQLSEESWPEVLKQASAAMELRAQVNGKVIEYEIDPSLPTVGVDRISVSEVVNNLLDNAIKYSPPASKRIVVRAAVNKEGLVETTVQDFGAGIPESAIPNLFEKFYRSHRTKGQIGGTGLGLYLSKAIITAHGGNIWVKSKVGEGTTIGFSLQPYKQLADHLKNSNNTEIVRQAHGWIKNHSMYRK